MTSKIVKGTGTKENSRTIDLSEEGHGVLYKRVLDARGKADKILKDAELEAARIKEEAKRVLKESMVRSEEAVKKGYANGESKGLAKVTENLVALERLRERFYEQAEPEVIKLSISIAEKVIGRLAAENSELIKTVVRQALEKTLGDRIVIRMHPEDYRAIMDAGSEFRENLDKTKRLAFRADEGITKGGCIVESEVGTIDAQLELQLDAVRKALEI